MVPIVGSIDPVLGTFKGVVRRPIQNDFCLHYERDVFGIVVPVDVACNVSQCVVEGNCPQASLPSMQTSLPSATALPTEWIPGISNTVILVVVVAVVAGLIFWRKTNG